MEPADWAVIAGPVGPASVIVNDADVTELVEAFAVTSRPGSAPLLALHVKAGATAQLEGPGIVEVVGPGTDAAAFLANIDPQALGAEVLKRSGMGDDPMSMALTVLREWAAGK